MRWLVVALVACSSSADEPCPQIAVSEIQHAAGMIMSGKNLIGITWSRQFQNARPEIHAAIVAPDGTIGPDIALGERITRAATGTTTILWTADDVCGAALPLEEPFTATLQRGGQVTFVDPSPRTVSRVAAFDGQRYQLFWVNPPNIVQHQTLDEDGTRGPVRTLSLAGACVDTATDGAGTTFLRVDNKGYIFDPATGDARLVFIGTEPAYGRSFWFAGRFYVFDEPRLLAFPPTSTGAFSVQALTGDLAGAQEFFPTDTTLFAIGFAGIVEVNTAFATVRRYPYPTVFATGAFGSDLVHWEHQTLDPQAMTPGRIELVRENMWRREVAVDSPVRMVDACEHF
jgi:hypothetical protein